MKLERGMNRLADLAGIDGFDPRNGSQTISTSRGLAIKIADKRISMSKT
ncbi:MAG: hypothetical protein JSW72_01910 [Candidatus Bathyarchaeota archaeon]|nr:MAG: hypothetical protein JSW72_01910 [Candidatus Bathyarchaeota archaeon]